MTNSSYHFEAHKNYIRGIDEATCRFMSELSEDKDICAFVTHTESCHEAENMVDYLHLAFCVIAKHIDVSFTLATMMLLGILSFLMLILCTVAFHSIPNVLYLIKYLKMNEHNAGASILVLFNGLPDIISAFFLFEGDTEMLVNEMLGTSLYLRAFHTGVLIFLFPLTLYGKYFMRDTILYLLGILVLFSILSERDTTLYEGILAMVFYPALCIIIYFDHRAECKARKGANHKDFLSDEMTLYLELTKEIEIIKLPTSSVGDPLDLDIWKQFFIVINPLRKEMYDDCSKWQRVLLILGTCFAIPYKLFVPIVNLMMPGQGWSKILIMFNFLLSPCILLPFFGFQYFLPFITIGFVMAFLVLCFTSHKEPKYQFFLTIYGTCCQLLITNILASETLSILSILGNIFGVKRPITGTTFLAWGNTIPEIITYCTLVRWNIKTLPLIGFLVAPLLNMIFAIGLTTVLLSNHEKSIIVATRPGDTGISGIWFSILHHILLSFAILTTNFHLRKSIGIYSILIYLIFIFYTYLYQFDLIHAFGSDHNDEKKFSAVAWA